MSPMLQSLLEKRGITGGAVAAFLKPEYERDTHDPFLLQDMDKAVSRLLLAIEKGERIAVYADFDCDGIPGAALLSDFFERIKYPNFEIYIPHRDLEGYGFHEEAIRSLASRGVSLIITVDVGTTAVASVAFAKRLGIDVIVTDHHEIPPAGGRQLPDAVAILNPKLGEYPFRHLCGAAVAFKFVQAVLRSVARLRESQTRGAQDLGNAALAAIPSGWEKWLLDLVGIATIADMVPLVGENRVLAYYGLQVLRKSPRPGIIALCEKLRLRQRELTEDDIGFSIAPRINAASRMDEPRAAFELLTTRDPLTARARAAHLEDLNARRKGVVAGIVKKAKSAAAERYTKEDIVVVLGDTQWKPALLGLAANSIMQERGGVVCMWGIDGNGNIKGSCRSDGSVSLVELFGGAREHLEEAGGHECSGGFSVSHENVHTLAGVLKDVASKLGGREGDSPREVDPSRRSEAEADAHVTLPQITQEFFVEVSKLAPFGIGNPKPVFLITHSSVVSVKRFGKEQNHVEVQLVCSKSGVPARAFDFFRAPEDFTLVPERGSSALVHATLERDTFRGGLALRLIDIMPM